MSNIKLIKGDCLEKMDELIEKGIQFDLILTDPPYGTMKGANLDGWGSKNTDWDMSIDATDIFNKSEKLLRENGQLILFSQEPYTSQLRTKTIDNLLFSYSMIWEKDHFANALIAKKAPVSYFEDISVFYKKYDVDLKNPLRNYSRKIMNKLDLNLKQINKILGNRKAEHFFYWNTSQFKLPTENTYNELIKTFKINEFDFYISYDELKYLNSKFEKKFNLYDKNKKSNILKYKKEYGERFHPTQKPVLLLEDLIKTYSDEKMNILDFTMGSASTGIACINTNRNFIGIEKDDKYFDISCDRINTYIKDNNLENVNVEIESV